MVVLVVTRPLFPTRAARLSRRLPRIVAALGRDARSHRISQDGGNAVASHARAHRRHRRARPSACWCAARVRGSAWATRRVGDARARGAANEVGMVRLFDLHALSCAGDTLIAIGLAGTIFFNVPLGEARSKVALYLLDHDGAVRAAGARWSGPLLDHFRHGRRYALAATMLGRAFLAYVISDNLLGFGLYPAAFGVLALSRAYGVARSAAVPRLLPRGHRPVPGRAPGPACTARSPARSWRRSGWPRSGSARSGRCGSPRSSSWSAWSSRCGCRRAPTPTRPRPCPRPFRTMLRLRRGSDRPLSGRLVIATLIGSASLRCLYGFLLLFFAFAIKAGQLDTTVFGRDIGSQGAVGAGRRRAGGRHVPGHRDRHPAAHPPPDRAAVQRPDHRRPAWRCSRRSSTACRWWRCSAWSRRSSAASPSWRSTPASRNGSPERLRASAFAHSETVLMIAWVVGGAIGIIPLDGRLGVGAGGAVRRGRRGTRRRSSPAACATSGCTAVPTSPPTTPRRRHPRPRPPSRSTHGRTRRP